MNTYVQIWFCALDDCHAFLHIVNFFVASKRRVERFVLCARQHHPNTSVFQHSFDFQSVGKVQLFFNAPVRTHTAPVTSAVPRVKQNCLLPVRRLVHENGRHSGKHHHHAKHHQSGNPHNQPLLSPVFHTLCLCAPTQNNETKKALPPYSTRRISFDEWQ